MSTLNTTFLAVSIKYDPEGSIATPKLNTEDLQPNGFNPIQFQVINSNIIRLPPKNFFISEYLPLFLYSPVNIKVCQDLIKKTLL